MRRVIAGTGKALITLGILILCFVAYQLWGTGLYTARAQNQLERDFREALRRVDGGGTPTFPSSTTSAAGATTVTTVAPTTTTEPPPRPPEGDAVAHLVIPRIGVDSYVVQGVGEADLRRGPGHYPLTPLPGQAGNAAIAGHRTTYGAPFGDLDVLEVGDTIRVTTLQGSFAYRVYDKLVVSPDDLEVLRPDDTRLATLTLTTCNPKYSAAERLIIKAELELPPGVLPLPPPAALSAGPTREVRLSGEGLSGESGSRLPTLVTGLIAAVVGGLWWLIFHRHPRWTTWLAGVLPFAVALFTFYFFLERVLPANY